MKLLIVFSIIFNLNLSIFADSISDKGLSEAQIEKFESIKSSVDRKLYKEISEKYDYPEVRVSLTKRVEHSATDPSKIIRKISFNIRFLNLFGNSDYNKKAVLDDELNKIVKFEFIKDKFSRYKDIIYKDLKTIFNSRDEFEKNLDISFTIMSMSMTAKKSFNLSLISKSNEILYLDNNGGFSKKPTYKLEDF